MLDESVGERVFLQYMGRGHPATNTLPRWQKIPTKYYIAKGAKRLRTFGIL